MEKIEANKWKRAAHVLVLPYPSQGHINPMFQFCKRLASQYGIKTTLATTVFISKTFHPNPFPSVQFETISDGFDDGGFAQAASVGEYLVRMEAAGSKTLAELIERHKYYNPIDCVVYDAFLPWALDVAKQYGLAGAAFFTQACTVNYILYCVHHGVLKLPISSFPVDIDGLRLLGLGLHDMPSFISVQGSYPAYFQMVLSQFSNFHQADFVLVNSVYEFEQEAADSMSKVCRLLTIGPTVPSFYLDNRIKDDKEYGLNLFTSESNASISNWLNTKAEASVVYVAFGSMANLSEEQMEEVALGLKATKFDFLWVVRASEEAKLPHKFVEDTSEKGLIVKWCPQLEVLSHAAVGCFFTHCGWNSTIEALSLGVPMVGMPQWTDQPTDAKLIADLWKVGVRVKVDHQDHGLALVGRREIELCIRQVMQGDTATQIRTNSRKWRNLALQAIHEGGTSDKNIREFISKLNSSKHPHSSPK